MTRTTVPPAAAPDGPARPIPRRGPWPGVVIGLVCAGVAIGIAQLVAGVANPSTSPIVAVGSATIDATPEWLKSFAIRTFGSNDKTVLLGGIGVVLAIVAAGVGVFSVRRPQVGYAALGVLGLMGVLVSLTRPGATPAHALPALAGAAAGALTLRAFLVALEPADAETKPPTPGRMDRQRFVLTGIAGAAAAVVAGGTGRAFGRRFEADASRAAVRLPSPATPAVDATGLDVPGLSSFITPNADFYRVDTALLVPAVKAEDWSLRIHGMVERELTLTFDELMARSLIEREVTLTCVSNEVGGEYVGNARWLGAPLKDLLEEAGVDPASDQVVSRSVDGFTAGSPAALLMDGRDAMLAIAMNGEPLPLEHGFPVRMVVPGLFGYVSATKWIVDLELTTFDAFDAYWIRRGWAQRAPIKTGSRIDTPRGGQDLIAGVVPVAGVAWAQHRGVSAVELRIDGGDWTPAELSEQPSTDTWRQWLVRWDAAPGGHRLQVRATDGEGQVQTDRVALPFPDGATGYHTINVDVTTG